MFHRYADRDGWVTRWLVDASLPVYLVHLPVLVVVAGGVVAAGIGPVIAMPLTVVLTAVGSFAAYELLNLHPWTRFAFTGDRVRGASLLDGRRVRTSQPHGEQASTAGVGAR